MMMVMYIIVARIPTVHDFQETRGVMHSEDPGSNLGMLNSFTSAYICIV